MVDAEGYLCLADFGTTMLDVEDNWEIPSAGTLVFMPPEWLNEQEAYYGKRRPGDIWGVGVVLYEMLFGGLVCPVYHSSLSFVNTDRDK